MPVTDIGIDLGTATIIVYVKGKGIMYQEPSLVAYDRDANKIMAFGSEAQQILGRTAGNIMAIHPLKQGVISDFLVLESMLRYFIRKSMSFRNFLKPRICICVPSGVRDIERRAVEEAAYRAGARDAEIVKEPIVAAIGAGLDIMRPNGNMVVNIGGGLTDIAVLSLGGIVMSQTLKVAGESFNEAIREFIRQRHNLIIGEQTAEEIKILIGSVSSDPELTQLEVKGRDSNTGIPRTIHMTRAQVLEAVRPQVRQIVEAVRGVIEKTPPDLAADVAGRGIVLTGGGAMLAGMEDAIAKYTGIPTVLVDNPQQTVAQGTGLYIQQMSAFDKR